MCNTCGKREVVWDGQLLICQAKNPSCTWRQWILRLFRYFKGQTDVPTDSRTKCKK